MAALVLAERQPSRFISSDIVMPKLDGHELLRQIHRASSNLAASAVALTGYGSQDALDKAQQAGFNRHLTKPINLDRLIAVAMELLLC